MQGLVLYHSRSPILMSIGFTVGMMVDGLPVTYSHFSKEIMGIFIVIKGLISNIKGKDILSQEFAQRAVTTDCPFKTIIMQSN